MIEILQWMAFMIGGYLLGGVMFCRLLPQLILRKDVTKLFPDRNPAAANVFSSCGAVMGMACLLLDMAKGFLPVFLGTIFLDPTNMLFAAVIVAPVLGHATGVFNHFRGGKCIATSFGVVIGLLPVTWVGWILAAVYIIFSVFVKINPHRRRSIFAFAIFGILSCIILIFTRQYSVAIGCLLLSAVAVVKHSKRFSPDETPAADKTALQDDDESLHADGKGR